jgi:hypothetical protein
MIYEVWVAEGGKQVVIASTASKKEALDAFEAKQKQQADVHMTCSNGSPRSLLNYGRRGQNTSRATFLRPRTALQIACRLCQLGQCRYQMWIWRRRTERKPRTLHMPRPPGEAGLTKRYGRCLGNPVIAASPFRRQVLRLETLETCGLSPVRRASASTEEHPNCVQTLPPPQHLWCWLARAARL